jgi:starch synthase
MTEKINIFFLAAEAEPFVKIGGLADVAGSLPIALRSLSTQTTGGVTLDVRLVLPFHHTTRVEVDTLQLLSEFSIYRRGGNIPVQVFTMIFKGMPVYFIKSDLITGAPSVYSSDLTLDREKFTLFSLAALKLLRYLDWLPDIIHSNDWHSALALYALRFNWIDSELAHVRTVITVHNLPYMGGDGSDVLSAYGLTPLTDEAVPKWARTQPLPLGLWAADIIIPVSPTYAREILTADFGCGLETYLRTRSTDLKGILNGLDVNKWNPVTDEALAARFSHETLALRVANKTTLQKNLILEKDPHVPLLAMIGRIDQQKGMDILFEVLRQIADRSWQFIMLGTGNEELENAALNLQEDFPDRIRTVIRYDEEFARLLYGGADILLMPSRYEPCGLAQMIAMRYGCVPVVHATGGLKDTVREGTTGFLFPHASSKSMKEAIIRALDVYASPENWLSLQNNDMQEDFSWLHSACQYANIYHTLMSGS